MNNRTLGFLAAFGATLIYGLNHTIAKNVMPTYISPFGFILLRVLGASLLFWLLSCFIKSEKIDKNLLLKPALSLKVKVAFIRTIDKGVSVSYGGKFVSHRKTKLAVLSIGYADGVPRNLSGKINVIHNNKFYPQVGSITMDQMMVDITDSNEIQVGSTMLLLGSDGDKTISPLDWARESNTIPWEILCSFKNRLPKVHVD